MNRTQAEHLLSAYLEVAGKRKQRRSPSKEKVAEVLKDVILDAMCYGGCITTVPYYPYRYPSWTWTPSWTSTSATGTTVGDITAKPGTTTTISGNGSL